jgi:hypothetical protein
MPASDIIQQIGQKGADIDSVVDRIIEEPGYIPVLIGVIDTEKGSIKFRCEKALRLISERHPEMIYPYFEFFAKLLESDNTFLRCGAIMTIANLTTIDDKKLFENIFALYYSLIAGPALIPAANVIGNSVKIAESKPELADRIAEEILKVEKAEYLNKGILSPECNNVACGQAIKTFDSLFAMIEHKKPVIEFAKRLLKSTRGPVVKSAEKFLKKHRIAL